MPKLVGVRKGSRVVKRGHKIGAAADEEAATAKPSHVEETAMGEIP